MTKGRKSSKDKNAKSMLKMKGGNGEVMGASEGILSDKTIIPSSRFESTGTGGVTSKFETAVMPSTGKMSGGRRRSKKSKRSSNRRKSVKKWFGLF